MEFKLKTYKQVVVIVLQYQIVVNYMVGDLIIITNLVNFMVKKKINTNPLR